MVEKFALLVKEETIFGKLPISDGERDKRKEVTRSTAALTLVLEVSCRFQQCSASRSQV